MMHRFQTCFIMVPLLQERSHQKRVSNTKYYYYYDYDVDNDGWCRNNMILILHPD